MSNKSMPTACNYYDKDTEKCKAVGAMCTYLGDSDKCIADHPDVPTMCHCYDKDRKRCNGTRECDPCTCEGNTKKCDFYPEKRSDDKKDPITVDDLREALKSQPIVITPPEDMIPKWYLFKTEVDLGVRYDQVSILVACTDKEMSEESLYTSKIYKVLDQMYRIENYRVLDVIQLEPDKMYLTQIAHTNEPAVVHKTLH